MNIIQPDSFAEACYNQNSLTNLMDALKQSVDKSDCTAWGISEQEWRKSIEIAISNKLADQNKEI